MTIDVARSPDNNQRVSRVARVVVHLLTALAVTGASLLVPEHVHETDAEHGASVTHRHVEFHHHDNATLEDADGHVVWLDAVAVHSEKTIVGPVFAVAASAWDAPTLEPIGRYDSRHLTAPAHGPPRVAPSPRAPPLPTV